MDKQEFEKIIRKSKAVIEKIKAGNFNSVCICGSSRFCDIIAVVKLELEKQGVMATGLHYLPQWYLDGARWNEDHHGAEQENVAHVLDELHLRKINKYDCVLVVNAFDCIGDRTKIEIDYARQNSKVVFYWE